MRDFLETQFRGTKFVTGKTGTPIDFIAFHAKGLPEYVDGHVRMGISNQLSTIADGFRIVASYPELKSKRTSSENPNPGRLCGLSRTAVGYRNSTMYSSYTAASFARKHDLAERHGVNLEARTWAFEFEDTPFFAGFRALCGQRHEPAGLQCVPHVQQDGCRAIAATSNSAADLDTIVKQGVRERPTSRGEPRFTPRDHPHLALPR